MSLYRSAIGNFSVSNLQDVAEILVYGVLPLLNQKLEKGVQLPIVADIELSSPVIVYQQNYLVVVTNVRYIGFEKNFNSTQTLKNRKY